MMILPRPNCQIASRPNCFSLHNQLVAVDADSFSMAVIKAFSDRHGLQIEKSAADQAKLILRRADSYQPEEYDLDVTSDGIIIQAAGEAGIIWALASLTQIMDEQGVIACCHLHDQPRYAHRGLSLDCARHFFPVQTIKDIIGQMSLVKMNRLHWHLTDDQGWRIESKRFPKLHGQHGTEYYKQTEIAEIVAFAQARGIEIIPEIEMPGHITALLAAYPEYSCSGQAVELGQRGGIYPVILCAGREKTYELIETLLDEICPLFPAKFFHIGGDEAPKREWQACPVCQQKIRDEGLKNEVGLQGYFSNRVIDLLARRGKKTICWNDSLEAVNLTRQTLAQFWSVQYTDSLEKFIGQNGQFIYSDMFAFYLDYPHSMTSLRRLYQSDLSIADIDYAEHPALLGIEACVWSERLSTRQQLEEKLFPRIYAAAEKMWSRQLDYDDFTGRLRSFLKRYHPASISCVPEDRWNPQGEDRRHETLAFMAAMNEGLTPEVRAEIAEYFVPNEQFSRKFATSFFDPEDRAFLQH